MSNLVENFLFYELISYGLSFSGIPESCNVYPLLIHAPLASDLFINFVQRMGSMPRNGTPRKVKLYIAVHNGKKVC